MLHRLISGKIWAENKPIKVLFVLKSLLLNSMKLKKKSHYCKQVPFEPKIKILVAEDDSISLKFISKF
jgi:hypothetical protein